MNQKHTTFDEKTQKNILSYWQKMKIKEILGTWPQNLKIIIGAICVGVGIFYIANNPEMFTASILSLQEQETIQDQWRDIAYKTDSGYVDIFVATTKTLPPQIIFSLAFNPTTIHIDANNISGQGLWTYTNKPESMTITFTPNQNTDKTQSIIMIPFTGNQKEIILSEAIKIDHQQSQDLSIGSLNTTKYHSK